MKPISLLPTIAVLQCDLAAAQDTDRKSRAYPPEMPGAKVETFKTVGFFGGGYSRPDDRLPTSSQNPGGNITLCAVN